MVYTLPRSSVVQVPIDGTASPIGEPVRGRYIPPKSQGLLGFIICICSAVGRKSAPSRVVSHRPANGIRSLPPPPRNIGRTVSCPVSTDQVVFSELTAVRLGSVGVFTALEASPCVCRMETPPRSMSVGI